MSIAGPTLWVGLDGDVAVVRVCGRASFACGPDLKRVIAELQARGWHKFVFDLSECSLMDSTFLGIMAGFGMRVEESQGTKAVLKNASSRIIDMLDNLGVAHLFDQTQGPVETKCEPTQCGTLDKLNATRTSLEAHQTLMAINPANVSKFKDVTRFLADDIKKLTPPVVPEC